MVVKDTSGVSGKYELEKKKNKHSPGQIYERSVVELLAEF